jgi:hypothetical protein
MGFALAYWPWTLTIDAAYFLLGVTFFMTGRFGAKKENVVLVCAIFGAD